LSRSKTSVFDFPFSSIVTPENAYILINSVLHS
jgi:hypothetical protein